MVKEESRKQKDNSEDEDLRETVNGYRWVAKLLRELAMCGGTGPRHT